MTSQSILITREKIYEWGCVNENSITQGMNTKEESSEIQLETFLGINYKEKQLKSKENTEN